MTFVLNLLHPRFSILAADTRAGLPQGAVIQYGSTTIRAAGNVTLNGWDKVRLAADRRCAAAVAGNTASHPYFDRIPETDTAKAIELARAAALDWTSLERFRLAELGGTHMDQSVIATMFDDESARFWSFMAIAIPGEMSAAWYSHGGRGRLLHVGSGSARFEKAVGLDAINAFIASLAEDTEPEAVRAWLADAFGKVSELDPGSSAEFRGVVATQEEPEFRPW